MYRLVLQTGDRTNSLGTNRQSRLTFPCYSTQLLHNLSCFTDIENRKYVILTFFPSIVSMLSIFIKNKSKQLKRNKIFESWEPGRRSNQQSPVLTLISLGDPREVFFRHICSHDRLSIKIINFNLGILISRERTRLTPCRSSYFPELRDTSCFQKLANQLPAACAVPQAQLGTSWQASKGNEDGISKATPTLLVGKAIRLPRQRMWCVRLKIRRWRFQRLWGNERIVLVL